MDPLAAALLQHEKDTSFVSSRHESCFETARATYIDERRRFHLEHPEDADLDVLSFEDGQLCTFIKDAPHDLLEASSMLYREVLHQASMLAENDADEADYDTIMAPR